MTSGSAPNAGAGRCRTRGRTYPRIRDPARSRTRHGQRPIADQRRASAGAATRLPGVEHLIRVSDEVQAALAEERAVVALETTLVAHGFPAPAGIEVGLASETAVRSAGAVPATIGVLDGCIVVGSHGGGARAIHARRAQARPTRPRRMRRTGRGRRDHGRRHARGRGRGRHPLHGDGRPRRRPPRLPDAARTSRPTSAACARDPGGRRLVRSQVPARRAGDDGAPRDARHPRARLPGRHAAALLRRRGRAAGLGVASRTRARQPGSRTRTGGSAATRSSSGGRRTRASTSPT